MNAPPEDARAAGDWGSPSALVSALVFDADGHATIMEDAAAGAAPPKGGWRWLHFRLGDVRSQGQLRDFHFPHAAHELFGLKEDRLHLEQQDGWVFGVLPDLERDLAGEPQREARLVFAFRPDLLVTGRLHALRAVDDLRRAAEKGARFVGPAAALAEHIELYLDQVERLLDGLGARVSAIEDYVLTEPRQPRTGDLAAVRRRLARHRRELQGLRSALNRALGGRQAARIAALADALPELIGQIDDLDHEVAGHQERARLLYEEIDTLINAATNRSMRTLTVITTLLVPPTVIVGAFGMNVPGIPWDKSGLGFWLASGLCVLAVGAAAWILRRMDMI